MPVDQCSMPIFTLCVPGCEKLHKRPFRCKWNTGPSAQDFLVLSAHGLGVKRTGPSLLSTAREAPHILPAISRIQSLVRVSEDPQGTCIIHANSKDHQLTPKHLQGIRKRTPRGFEIPNVSASLTQNDKKTRKGLPKVTCRLSAC